MGDDVKPNDLTQVFILKVVRKDEKRNLYRVHALYRTLESAEAAAAILSKEYTRAKRDMFKTIIEWMKVEE